MTGFIGAGNMANAIIKGMVSSGAAEGKDIAVYEWKCVIGCYIKVF